MKRVGIYAKLQNAKQVATTRRNKNWNPQITYEVVTKFEGRWIYEVWEIEFVRPKIITRRKAA